MTNSIVYIEESPSQHCAELGLSNLVCHKGLPPKPDALSLPQDIVPLPSPNPKTFQRCIEKRLPDAQYVDKQVGWVTAEKPERSGIREDRCRKQVSGRLCRLRQEVPVASTQGLGSLRLSHHQEISMGNDLRGFYDPSKSGYKSRTKVKRKPKKIKKRPYKDFLKYEATPKQFYRSKAWRELRERVFKTYPRVCMCCGDSQSIMHVDHIQPRSKAPKLSLSFSNLQVLCEDCNMQKSNIHAEDYREDAAARELDRETALKAIELGL